MRYVQSKISIVAFGTENV